MHWVAEVRFEAGVLPAGPGQGVDDLVHDVSAGCLADDVDGQGCLGPAAQRDADPVGEQRPGQFAPFFGIISEVIPVFIRKPIFGYKGMVGATIAITAYETPMLFALGFLVTFLFGGLSGVILGSPPLDFHLNDSYFVVAHFHYVLFGTIVFAAFAGVYFWFPKMTGRMLDERLGRLDFWTMFIGFHTTFLVTALAGQPRHAPSLRRLPAHRRGLFLLWNVWESYRFGQRVAVADPWGFGNAAVRGHGGFLRRRHTRVRVVDGGSDRPR